MSRDDFTPTTKDILAKRVGYRCSNPNCRKLTSGPNEANDKAINIGVAAHITAAAEGGPRYDASLTEGERKSSENGIWLCQNCAKLIDSDIKKYSIDNLKEWKKLSEQAALMEIEKNTSTIDLEDVEIINFYAQCFDRPAFQDHFHQEGSMEAFDRAIEDTIIALNTGTLRTRDDSIVSKSKGKSYIKNIAWQNQLSVIIDLLRAIRERYLLAVKNGEIRIHSSHQKDYQSYTINDRKLSEWFDETRFQILNIFTDICASAGISVNFDFPRKRKYW